MTEPASDPQTEESLELVRRAQDGELPAFERLFERYYLRVLAVVRARLGTGLRRELDSGDLLHEALVDAIRSFASYEVRDEASLIHWLSKIVENQIRQSARYHRAEKRDRGRERALDQIMGSHSSGRLRYEPAVSADAPLDELAQLEEKQRMQEALGELPDGYREVIALRHYAGASWQRVAEITGSPSADAARMTYGRALLELRRALGAV